MNKLVQSKLKSEQVERFGIIQERHLSAMFLIK